MISGLQKEFQVQMCLRAMVRSFMNEVDKDYKLFRTGANGEEKEPHRGIDFCLVDLVWQSCDELSRTEYEVVEVRIIRSHYCCVAGTCAWKS